MKRLSLDVSNETRSMNCKYHGTYESRNLFSNVWSNCPECERINLENLVKQNQAEEKKSAVERWKRSIGSASIPLRFQNKKLATFIADTPEKENVVLFATKYADEFKNKHSGRCAIFNGRTGTGKTHIAIAIALRAMSRYNISALFTTVSQMVRRIREAKSFNAVETETQAINVFTFPDLLIIDEIGIQSGTDTEARSMFDVINTRYEQCKPTIFLSNLDIKDIRATLGDRIFDRLREDGGENIVFDWSSFRGSK